eukprot:3476341-Heterocapsa_arctica.AAC.1
MAKSADPDLSATREDRDAAGRDAVMGPGKATAAPTWVGQGGFRDSAGSDARADKSRGAAIAMSRPESEAPFEHR